MHDQPHLHARILVIDDEQTNIDLLEMMLGRAGYHAITSATDPRNAVSLYSSQQPDLVLLDLLTPEIDGFALLQQFRALTAPDDYRPVLVLTADATPAAKERALSSGAKDFLTKPFDRTELLLRVRNLLETRLLYVQRQQQFLLLEQLYDQMQQTMRVRETTQSTIAHDLGQPLVVLKIASQLLRRRVAAAPDADPAALRQLDVIESVTARVLAITTELVDLARLQSGRALDLHLQPTDLVELTRGEARAQQLTTERHTVEVIATEDAIVGEWDAVHMTRVVSNLLDNASKYSPDGGRVTLRLSREQEHGQAWAVLSVIDEGLGIPEAELPRLFTWFRRGSNVVNRIPGTGIGLAGRPSGRRAA